MHAQVDKRLEQLRFESRGQARVKMITAAYVPTRASNDKRTRFLLMAPAGMLALVVGLTMLFELRAGRVAEPDQLSHKIGVEVYSIPPLPSLAPSHALARARPQEHLVAEYVHRIDHIREALCGGAHTGIGRCVIVTSAILGEGKTTLASQLAVRCSNAGATTLLIDADLRRPSLGRLLNVTDGPGLSDVLRGDATLEEALVHLPQIGCTLLPAGQPDTNPARLLLGRKLGPMIEQLRVSYEVVIIDTPPVLPVPDALTLGRFADGAVLATRFDASRMRLVERAHSLLLSTGIPVLGAVLSGVQSSKHFGGAYGASYGTYASASDERVS
jgi:capsular exopolysaccharide synthesis family protein